VQEYSGNSNYANVRGNSISNIQLNTGKSDDKVCNIHDMASNCREWSTEYYNLNSRCVSRGGDYYYGNTSPGQRVNNDVASTNNTFSFRALFYIK